jgi:hypothetical protein
LPHVVIDFHDFRDGYGLPIERINPHRIKNKNVQEIELKGYLGKLKEGVGTLLLIVIMLKSWIESRKDI